MAMDDDHIDLTEHEESDTTEKEVNKASNTDVQIDVSKRPLFKHYVSIKAKDRFFITFVTNVYLICSYVL